MAADKSLTMKQLNDITECCICLKIFTDPRMLPCIHTFCSQCLQELAEKSNKKPGDELQCPVCRKKFNIPGDGIQCVQKNFFMVSFIEVRNALSQFNMTHPCDICKGNNQASDAKISEATMRCLVCLQNFCEACCKMHDSFKAMEDHKTIKLGSEVGEEEIIKSLKVMNCHIHRGKPLDYYCADCKKIVCVSCFVESHKTHDCKDVNTVEEEFRKNIKNSANIISTLAEEILDKRKKVENKEEFLIKIATRESEILQRSKEMKDMIDEHSKFLLSSLDEIKNRHLKEIQMEEEELDRRYTILESFSRYCDELRSKGSASDVCRNKDELLQRANELEEDHESYVMQPPVSFDVTFQATEFDNNWLKTTTGNIIGNIKENLEHLENICVVIGGDQNMYRINLRRNSDTVSCMRKVPTKIRINTPAAVYDNTMFISGVGETLGEIWKYNFASGWKRCGSLVQKRIGHCAEFIGETLYTCGGKRKDIMLKSIEAYNALTQKSTKVGQLKAGVCDAGCIAYNGSIYVFGGKLLENVQVYNPVENICTLISMPMPVCSTRTFFLEFFFVNSYSFRCVLWRNFAILFGHCTCFILDLNEKIWTERQQFKVDEDNFLMIAENGRIFVIGGSDRDDVRHVRASSILNNEAANWKTHTHLRKSFSVCAIANLTVVKCLE